MSSSKINISVRPELRRFMEEKVRLGRYADIDQAVNDAIALAKTRDELNVNETESLREQVLIGIKQLERGEVAVFDAKSVAARGRKILARQKAKRR